MGMDRGVSPAPLGTLDNRVPVPPRASSFSDLTRRDSSDATWFCKDRVVSRCVRIVVRSCSFSVWHAVTCELRSVQPPKQITTPAAKSEIYRMIRLHSNQSAYLPIPAMLKNASMIPVLTLFVPLKDHMLSITSTII